MPHVPYAEICISAAAILIAGALGVWLFRRSFRIRWWKKDISPACPQCDYNMSALETLECPECGRRVASANEWVLRRHHRWPQAALMGVAAWLLFYAITHALMAVPFCFKRWQVWRAMGPDDTQSVYIGYDGSDSLLIRLCKITDQPAAALARAMPGELGHYIGFATSFEPWTCETRAIDLDSPTDDQLERISGFDSVTHLGVSGAHISDVGMKHLARMKNLKNIVLQPHSVTTVGYRELEKLKSLEVLYVYCNSQSISPLLENFCGALLYGGLEGNDTNLTQLPNLRTQPSPICIDIRHCTLSNQACDDLAGASRLRRLNLKDCKLEPGGMARLARSTSIRWLDLIGPSFDEKEWQALRDFQSLEVITIIDPGKGSRIEEAIADLPRLNVLNTTPNMLGPEALSRLSRQRANGRPPIFIDTDLSSRR